jgi:transposase
MAQRAGTANLPLHGGQVPRWLADRMTRLGAVIGEAIVHHYGRDELLRRLAHPFWFQSFGAVMGMDWHSSGITTSVIGALVLQPIIDEHADEAQRNALFYILSGEDQPVGTMFQIFSVIVETIKDPAFARIEMLWGRRRGDGTIVAVANRWSAPMPQPNDLSRSLVALDQDSTIIAVVEMSQSSWLVAGMLPGIERQPRKKLEPSAERLLGLLHRWRDEAVKAGRKITRIALAFEAGRDGFWLARWLRAHGVEAHVIHPSSVAVSREHRRAKTDRLDTELLKRGFLGWLRGERGHCTMARIPTIAEEDAKRPNRERECLVRERTRIVNRMKGTLARLGIRNFKPTLRKAAERVTTLHTPEGSALPPNVSAELQRNMARLGFVVSQIKEIEAARQKRLEQEPETEPHAMVRHLARVVGLGVETADILVNEVLSRPMRDRKAVARYAGLTGSPDESGAKRREQGLAKAGNARVRRGMIQLAWRFLRFQKESALALWYRARTADSRVGTRKTMIVALARKLLIALWRFVTTGETLEGVVLRPAG